MLRLLEMLSGYQRIYIRIVSSSCRRRQFRSSKKKKERKKNVFASRNLRTCLLIIIHSAINISIYRITVTRKQLLARIPKSKTVIRFKFHAERAWYVSSSNSMSNALYIAIAVWDKSVCRVVSYVASPESKHICIYKIAKARFRFNTSDSRLIYNNSTWRI